MLPGVCTHAEYLAASDEIESGLSESELTRLASGRCATAREKMRVASRKLVYGPSLPPCRLSEK